MYRTGKIILTAVIIYGISLFFRLYKLDYRMNITGDAGRELMYAANIVRDRQPMLISMETSGSNIPNLPYYINFLAGIMALCRNDLVATVSVFCVITAVVSPLLFLWGVIEGSWIAGAVAGTAFAIFSPTIDLSNVWGNQLAFVPAVAGIVLVRYSARNQAPAVRTMGWISLCVAGALHYSHIALLCALILTEGMRSRSKRTILHDSLVSGVTLAVLSTPLLAIARAGALPLPRIVYTDTGPLSMQTIRGLVLAVGDFLFPEFGRLNPNTFLFPHLFVVLLPVAAGAVLGSLSAWSMSAVFLFLVLALLFAGQAAPWYANPVLPFCFLWFGQIVAAGLRHRAVIVRGIAVLLAAIVLYDSADHLKYRITSEESQYRTLTDAATIVRTHMALLGIHPPDYIEYAFYNQHPPYRYGDTTALWLARQLIYGEKLTYSDPTQSYYPIPYASAPPYKVLVTNGCGSEMHDPTDFDLTGYTVKWTVCDEPSETKMVVLGRQEK